MVVASCHCGAVRLEVARKPRQLTDCNCSICRRNGALWAYYSRKTVKVTSAPGAASAYVWGDGTLELYHCNICGCVTHHERTQKRPDSTVGVNARMMDPEAIASARIRRLDGADTWKYVDE
ncbi:MAG TPA: GFA family protein [Thermoanaerobaculia bacterium]|nr:GFA family protein [Thermoanaerobaculia bacterium]